VLGGFPGRQGDSRRVLGKWGLEKKKKGVAYWLKKKNVSNLALREERSTRIKVRGRSTAPRRKDLDTTTLKKSLGGLREELEVTNRVEKVSGEPERRRETKVGVAFANRAHGERGEKNKVKFLQGCRVY